jgi:uncharacterized membrane protein YagU involved in acid resistance
MKNQLAIVVISGLAGSVAMSLGQGLLAMLGLPPLSPPDMMAQMVDKPLFAGWMMHLMIGIVFAIAYRYLLYQRLQRLRVPARGLLLGVAAFVGGQVGMGVMGLFLPFPEQAGAPALIMIASIVGHVVYGLTVVWIVEALSAKSPNHVRA